MQSSQFSCPANTPGNGNSGEDEDGAAEKVGCERFGESDRAEGEGGDRDEVGDDGGAGGSFGAYECVVDDVGESGADDAEDGEGDPGRRGEGWRGAWLDCECEQGPAGGGDELGRGQCGRGDFLRREVAGHVDVADGVAGRGK